MYKEAFEKIKGAKSVVLATHIDPDADTLGSALGLYHILNNQKVTLFNASKIPYNLDFLPDIDKFKNSFNSADVLVSFDCGSFDRLGIDSFEGFIINIDHHSSNEMFGDINIIEPEFGATAQVVYKMLEENGVKLNKNSAISLYTALVDDTGFFKYESVNSEVFRVASNLVEAGANPYYVSQMLTMREPLSKIRLIPLVLETLELFLDAKVGVVRLTQQMLKKSGASKEMADDALNMVRALAVVEVAVLLKEEEDGRIKVSLRSKNRVDVSKIAVFFGGGGHKNAAGYKIEGSFEDVLKKLLQKIKESFDEKG